MKNTTILCSLILIIWLQALANPSHGKSRLIENLKAGQSQRLVTFGTSLTKVGAWVEQVAVALDQQYPGQIKVINGAQGGANSDWGRKSLDSKVLQHKPDTVLIEFSVNDAVASRKTSVAHARANLENMIERILAANPETEIILMVMNPPLAHTLIARPQIESYNQMYRDVARERGFQLIDHYPVWQALLKKDPRVFFQYVPDMIHPVWAGALNVITPTLLEAIGAAPGKPGFSKDAPCWQYLKHMMDADRSGTITPAEFHAYWAKLYQKIDLNADDMLQREELVPAEIFQVFDGNGDGQVDPREYRQAFDWHFRKQDANGDGLLLKGSELEVYN